MAPKKRKDGAAAADMSTPKKAKKKGEEADEPDVDDIGVDTTSSTEPKDTTTSSSSESESFENESKTKDDRLWNFKISSWNVSGIRAWLKKDGLAYLEKENPDIFVLQEVKCSEAQIPDEAKNYPNYHTYWLSPPTKSGYSGVGLFTKTKPIKVDYGLGIPEHDNEGRMITAEYENFYLVSVYVPNSGRGLVRLAYRREWNTAFLAYLKRLDAIKPVICVGDLNVAHKPIGTKQYNDFLILDLARPDSNKKSAGFTKEEREDFTTWLESGFVDSFRALYPTQMGAYTYWAYFSNARGKNIGWRLDYFILSERLVKDLCDNVIRSKVMGSDHCPLTLFMSF